MKRIIPSIVAATALYFAAGGIADLPAQSSNPAPQVPVNIVADVYANYFVMQKALAEDSLASVPVPALAMASQVNQDRTALFRPELAAQAEALATATDLPTARQIFKAVSGYMIQAWRSGRTTAGAIHELHSPMDNVDWLQEGLVVQNPYQGKACLDCGTIVK